MLPAAQTGSLQNRPSLDRYTTVSERNYGFHAQLTRVFYAGENTGENAGADFLNEGWPVRFTLQRDKLLLRMKVSAPLANIQALEAG